jgi:hypothetical protein
MNSKTAWPVQAGSICYSLQHNPSGEKHWSSFYHRFYHLLLLDDALLHITPSGSVKIGNGIFGAGTLQSFRNVNAIPRPHPQQIIRANLLQSDGLDLGELRLQEPVPRRGVLPDGEDPAPEAAHSSARARSTDRLDRTQKVQNLSGINRIISDRV